MPLIVNGSVMRQPKLPLVPGAGGVPAWMETGLSAAPPLLSPFSTSSRYRAKQSRTRLLRVTASSRAASSARRSALPSAPAAKPKTASTKTAGSPRPLALRRDPHSARALDAGVRLHPLVGVPPRGVRDPSLTQGVSRTCRRLRAPAAAFAHLPPPSRATAAVFASAVTRA